MEHHRFTAAAGRRPLVARWRAWLWRIAPALGLFFLAPLTAEYLTGYDSSTGDIATLLAGLTVLAPLYGGAAVVIREVTRRSGRGWPSILLLGLAFGVLQAGLVDHSLFNSSYRDIDYWSSMLEPTLIPALGIGVYPALLFVTGHAIWSIGVPIAVVESFVPRRRTTPWLGNFGLLVTVAVYGLASALILADHVRSEQFIPSVPQLLGAAGVVVALVAAAFLLGRHPRKLLRRSVPAPWLVGVVAWLALSLPTLIELVLGVVGRETLFVSAAWPGVALYTAVLAGLAVAVWYWSRSESWSAAHRLALAAGALLTNAWLAFLIVPIGDVPLAAKLIHNAGFLFGSIALLLLAARLGRRST
jgi:hypothetical protein